MKLFDKLILVLEKIRNLYKVTNFCDSSKISTEREIQYKKSLRSLKLLINCVPKQLGVYNSRQLQFI